MRNKNSLRKSGVVVAAMCGALAFGALPVQTAANAAAAAPSSRGQFGPVKGLAADVRSAAGGYQVDAAWTALSGAVSYRATLMRANGTVAEQATVSQPAWRVLTTEPTGSNLRLQVVGINARNKKSRPATVTVTLPDLTAPTATYNMSSVGDVGTVTQLTLADNISSADQITREIDWGMGAGFVDWGNTDSVSRPFAEEGIYHPQVRLTDQAGNVRAYVLTLVVGDEAAPTGTYTVNPGTVWAKPSRAVTVTQLGLADDFSAAVDIQRWVIWGDDTAPESWTEGDTLNHAYTQAGTYVPTVRLTDQAGNVSEVPATAVVVKADTVAPTVTVRRPVKGAKRLTKWRTVRGTVADVDGTGTERVLLKAVQKRGQSWFAYKGGMRKWVKAGTTRAAAHRKARPARVAPGDGTWSHRFGSLRKGKLIVTARSQDRAGNLSQRVRVAQTLTRR